MPAPAEMLAVVTMILVVAGIVLVIGFVLLRDRLADEHHRRAMLAQWFCTRCGYDVRATPSETCPECGAPVPPKSPRSPAR